MRVIIGIINYALPASGRPSSDRHAAVPFHREEEAPAVPKLRWGSRQSGPQAHTYIKTSNGRASIPGGGNWGGGSISWYM